MGRDVIWVCDEKREYIEPYPLLLMGQALFVAMDLGRWYGCKIELLSDCGGTNDLYYLRTSTDERDAQAWGGTLADAYKDVTQDVIAEMRERFKDSGVT